MEKIADDIRHWEAAGNLPIEPGRAYEEEKNFLEYKLNEVNEVISKRDPTFWEKVASFCLSFVNTIIKLLPVLINKDKYFPKNIRKIAFLFL